MRYRALAADYDGTLATHGRVDEPTLEALRRLRATGRKLILVTGRVLEELREVFPNTALFDGIVAENGALLHRPEAGLTTVLAERPTESFVTALEQRGVGPIAVGRVIVATWEPHGPVVRDVIRELGLPYQVILNKRAVMVLPAGVDKATGLTAALAELSIAPQAVVAVGDAENDHAFLALCGYSVAVANALPALKGRVDLVTAASHGAGVTELIGRLIADDLAGLERRGGGDAASGPSAGPPGSRPLAGGPTDARGESPP
jgi:HAD superfamily hydrolase (TIGR01484 family)